MALALAAIGLAVVAGCGGDDDGRERAGVLKWQAEPLLVQPSTLPNDRILTGKLRNDGRDRADLTASDLRLTDKDGERVPGSAAFLQGFAHGLYPPTREPEGRPPQWEQLRLGRIARVLPGKTVPLTISWRQPAGTEPPVRIEWGRGSLPIPDKPPVSETDDR
jgi:hypothetical protein